MPSSSKQLRKLLDAIVDDLTVMFPPSEEEHGEWTEVGHGNALHQFNATYWGKIVNAKNQQTRAHWASAFKRFLVEFSIEKKKVRPAEWRRVMDNLDKASLIK